MQRVAFIVVLLFVVFVSIIALSQDTGVRAEALGQANLRSIPSVENSEIVNEIVAGTQYPVIGRSEFFPWVLLGDPATLQPIGWVFRDLVTITGNLNSVPFSTLDVEAVVPTASPTPTRVVPTSEPNVSQSAPDPVDSDGPAVTPGGGASGGDAQSPTIQSTPSRTPTANFAISGLINGEVNVRYGPGTEYPIVGRAQAGDVFELTAYHTQFPWVQVRFDESPNGFAWLAVDLLEITGNYLTLPPISQTVLNLPTLTPTPSVVQASGLNNEDVVPISPAFAALGERIWNQVLTAGFVPESSQFGAIYLQDLQTGEAITFGNNIAFSGTSINKIAILLEYFGIIDGTPLLEDAVNIANTMICSENGATNRLLGVIGAGDQLTGAERTTQLLRSVGIERTFLTAPYYIPTNLEPTPPPRPIEFPVTSADQQRANPNPTNQLSVEEMGWLLGAVYECAYRETGPLINEFNGAYTPQECRLMLHVMSNNTVDGLLKAGVPADVRVAHKHGWVDDTHGNAGVFFTPGGDYVLVMMLHKPVWLDFTTESLPLLAEVSRTVYNYFNSDEPLNQVREGYIPGPDECSYNAADPLVNDLAAPNFLEQLDPLQFYNPDAELDE